MRQSLALLALCAALRGAGAGPADASGGVNHGADGTTPCTNLVNGVATIEIARPEKKNALTRVMYQAMTDALVAANTDKSVRAVW